MLPPHSLPWATSILSYNAGDEAEELHMVAGVWRRHLQLLEHLAKGSWLSNSTGNQGNQMVMP